MSTKRARRIHQANRVLLRACGAGDEAAVRQALSWGADAVVEGLHLACRRHHPPVVDALLENPKAISVGFVGLREAAANGHLDLVQRLLGRGATPVGAALHFACQAGHANVVDALLPHVDCFDDLDYALTLAVRAGQVQVVNVLLQYGVPATKSTLFNAVSGGSVAIITLLQSQGLTYGTADWDNYLYAACHSGCWAAVDYVLQQGPSHPWKWSEALWETVKGYKYNDKSHWDEVVDIIARFCQRIQQVEPSTSVRTSLRYALSLPRAIPVSALLNANIPVAWFAPRAVRHVVAYRTHRWNLLVQHTPLYDVLHRLVDAYAGYCQPPPRQRVKGSPPDQVVDPPLRRSKRVKRSEFFPSGSILS